MSNFSLETLQEIWNNKTGECIEVGLDRDGCDLVEIRLRTDDHKITDRLSFTQEQLILLIEALQRNIKHDLSR